MAEVTTTPLHLQGESGFREDLVCAFVDLPNEVLVHILSYLDIHSALHLRMVCRRLRIVTNDPINWSSISWRASNRIKDEDGLKLALRLSKGVLKHLSLSSLNSSIHMSKYMSQIQSSHCLQSISLRGVAYTDGQLVKLLLMPALTYLELDKLFTPDIFHLIASVSDCQLKTLSLYSYTRSYTDFYRLVEVWSSKGFLPPDLRITLVPIQCELGKKMLHTVVTTAEPAAYLTLYQFTNTTEDLIPLQPYFQSYFQSSDSTPARAVPLASYGSKLLGLASNEPGSTRFSTAHIHSEKLLLGGEKINFVDICHNLTELRLASLWIDLFTPSDLQEFAKLCPQLVHLDLHGCKGVLGDLKGLEAVASACSRLRVLNLFELCRSDVECIVKLWMVLGSMSELRVLLVPIALIPWDTEPISMPKLSAITIRGSDPGPVYHTVDSAFNFLTKMHSLKVFKADLLPSVTIFPGFSNLLHASPNITHLYITKHSGNKLTLPTDPLCYTHLQMMFLHCEDFVFHKDLASALAQCHKLSVLILKVSSIDVKGIIELVDSLKFLSIFHIDMYSDASSPTIGSAKRAASFAKALTKRARKEGKIVDIRIKKCTFLGVALLPWFEFPTTIQRL